MRPGAARRLKHLLKYGLVIGCGGGFRVCALKLFAKRSLQEAFGGFKPAVQKDCRYQGFKGVGQNGALRAPAALLLASPYAQELSQLQTPRGPRQSGSAHKAVLHTRKLALCDVRVGAEE